MSNFISEAICQCHGKLKTTGNSSEIFGIFKKRYLFFTGQVSYLNTSTVYLPAISKLTLCFVFVNRIKKLARVVHMQKG